MLMASVARWLADALVNAFVASADEGEFIVGGEFFGDGLGEGAALGGEQDYGGGFGEPGRRRGLIRRPRRWGRVS